MAEFDFKQIFKGKTPVIYLRVSSQAQKQRGGGIKSQKENVLQWLKQNGIRKKPIVFSETGSGGDESGTRKEWKKMKAFILSQKNPSQYFIIMRDFTRWSRNVFRSAGAYEPLYDVGVELVSVSDNIATGSLARKDPDGEFIFGLWTALGSRERTGGAKRVKAGVDVARQELGVIGGQPMDISGQFRELMEQETGLRAGFVSYAGYGRTLKPKRGRSWMVKTMDKFDAIRKYGKENKIPDALGQWLDVVEKVREVNEQHGRKSRKYLAVQRMTSGFLKKPTEFWKFKPTDDMFATWLKNPTDYLASKGR